jgi:hypothetical protein
MDVDDTHTTKHSLHYEPWNTIFKMTYSNTLDSNDTQFALSMWDQRLWNYV